MLLHKHLLLCVLCDSSGQGIGFEIFCILTCMQTVLSKDLLVKCLNASCKPVFSHVGGRTVVPNSWEGRGMCGETGKRELQKREGHMSASPRMWKVSLTFIIQVRPAELHEFQLSYLPVGTPFRHGWIQELRQGSRALLRLSSLLLPCCPVWYRDGRQQLPAHTVTLLFP